MGRGGGGIYASPSASVLATMNLTQSLETSGIDMSHAHGTQSLRQEIKTDLELLRRDMTIKLGGLMFLAVGVILTAMRFMPHP